jgi:hypothetical protein
MTAIADAAPGPCEICSQLKDVETSFYKWGWEEMDRPLPPAAQRLAPVDAPNVGDFEKRHVRVCPVCGAYYLYEFSYEYLVNGSEDAEVLTRLTAAQAALHLAGKDEV